MTDVIIGIMIPFFGTAIGSACVFFMRSTPRHSTEKLLMGFAGGVMTAASVWSLLLPAIERASGMGAAAFLPAAVGLWIGAAFIRVVEVLSALFERAAEPENAAGKLRLLILAIVIHNVPEGMAVGIVYASWLAGGGSGALAGAFALACGIAVQNLPEGAIVSIPLHAQGKGKAKSFALGALSGAVEPVGAAAAIAASAFFLPLMPYFLSFAAGAMLYVVVSEMIPAAPDSGAAPVISFFAGFTLMMALDVALG